MADFKLVISDPKSGKTVQREVKDKEGSFFLNKQLRDKVNGDDFGLSGYEFEITGGSDYCGFPMRRGISGIKRKKILTSKSVGFRGKAKGRTKKKKKQKPKRKGLRRKKTVCGEVIHEKISQINLKILKFGKEKLFEAKAEEGKAAAEAPKAEAKPAEKKEVKKEAPKEEKKEPKKQEVKKEEKKPDKPVEKKEEAKKEEKKPDKPVEKKEEAKKEEKKQEKPTEKKEASKEEPKK